MKVTQSVWVWVWKFKKRLGRRIELLHSHILNKRTFTAQLCNKWCNYGQQQHTFGDVNVAIQCLHSTSTNLYADLQYVFSWGLTSSQTTSVLCLCICSVCLWIYSMLSISLTPHGALFVMSKLECKCMWKLLCNIYMSWVHPLLKAADELWLCRLKPFKSCF